MKKKELDQIICSNCRSNNVEQKMWVDLNTHSPKINFDFEEEDFWCNDCEGHHHVDLETLPCFNGKPRIDGYQVVNDDDKIHPKMDGSFCLYSLSQAREMIDFGSNEWKLLTIYKGDVEEPTKMFEGNDPRV